MSTPAVGTARRSCSRWCAPRSSWPTIPTTAARLGIDEQRAPLTPVEQDALPDGPLDEVLAGIGWPDEVVGCALAQEIVVLPPEAEADLDDGADVAGRAAQHPQRREARLTVGVLRDGTSAALLRLRATGPDEDDDLLTGPELAPNLVAALLATLH